MRALLPLLLAGCAFSPTVSSFDAGVDAGPRLQLVCGADSCGPMTDKNTGLSIDCGACPPGAECGDNGEPSVCGSACVPLADTKACDYAAGTGASWGLGLAHLQYPGACNYIDQDQCIPLWINWPANGICSGEICGSWWCCAGSPTLLPGASSASP